MKFNLKDLNPGTKFYFDDDSPEEGYVIFRICNGTALDAIEAATTKKKYEYKKGARYEAVEVDHKKRTHQIWDYCIVDWSGIEDADGVAIPCTTENKILLMSGSIQFAKFFSNSMDALNTLLSEIEVESEKN